MEEEKRSFGNNTYLLFGGLILLAAFIVLRVTWNPQLWWTQMLAGYVFGGAGFFVSMEMIPKFRRKRLYLAQHIYMAVCIPVFAPIVMTVFCLWYPPASVFPASCFVCGGLNMLLMRFAP